MSRVRSTFCTVEVACAVPIAADVLIAQVRQTAGWLFDDDAPYARTLAHAPSSARDYLQLLLTAHFCTVATFVPTDVDARIRFHEWQEMRHADALRAAVAVVDAVAAYPVARVSTRFVAHARGTLSGHDGEWLAVRAGALGRALQLGAQDVVEKVSAQIDDELAREAEIYTALEAWRSATTFVRRDHARAQRRRFVACSRYLAEPERRRAAVHRALRQARSAPAAKRASATRSHARVCSTKR